MTNQILEEKKNWKPLAKSYYQVSSHFGEQTCFILDGPFDSKFCCLETATHLIIFLRNRLMRSEMNI